MVFRVISKLDIKPPFVVKGIQLEGLRKIGDPKKIAIELYRNGIDEIIYQDIVSTLYSKPSIYDLVSQTAEEVFLPLTVGGGVSELSHAEILIRHGADKICVNSAAVKNHKLLTKISSAIGTQALVLGVEAKKSGKDWIHMSSTGRENSGYSVSDWIRIGEDNGVGEILITSVDNDGTRKGFDESMLEKMREVSNLPMIIQGGFSKPVDAFRAFALGFDGVVISSCFQIDNLKPSEIKKFLSSKGVEIRL